MGILNAMPLPHPEGLPRYQMPSSRNETLNAKRRAAEERAGAKEQQKRLSGYGGQYVPPVHEGDESAKRVAEPLDAISRPSAGHADEGTGWALESIKTPQEVKQEWEAKLLHGVLQGLESVPPRLLEVARFLRDRTAFRDQADEVERLAI